METKSWVILTIPVNTPRAIVNFELKIPKHVDTCTGVLFSTNTFIAKEGEDHIPIIGVASLWFNNKKNHTVHYFVDGLHPKDLKRTYSPLKQEQVLIGGSLVQGYWEDNQFAATYPYTAKIYFECVTCTCDGQ